LPVCNRLHCFDWAPLDPERASNQWRIQTQFDRGGWVELGVSKDEHGQAAYVEHWATIPGSREGPFLALRKSVGAGQDGLLVVAGSVFGYIIDRETPLVAEEGPSGLHSTAAFVAAEIAKIEEDPSAEAACRAKIESYLGLECSIGRVDGWVIDRSTYPWLEGTPLLGAGVRGVSLDLSTGVATVATGCDFHMWRLFGLFFQSLECFWMLFG
jgi:hypothetical protein